MLWNPSCFLPILLVKASRKSKMGMRRIVDKNLWKLYTAVHCGNSDPYLFHVKMHSSVPQTSIPLQQKLEDLFSCIRSWSAEASSVGFSWFGNLWIKKTSYMPPRHYDETGIATIDTSVQRGQWREHISLESIAILKSSLEHVTSFSKLWEQDCF